jgi:hypothetical protein
MDMDVGANIETDMGMDMYTNINMNMNIFKDTNLIVSDYSDI